MHSGCVSRDRIFLNRGVFLSRRGCGKSVTTQLPSYSKMCWHSLEMSHDVPRDVHSTVCLPFLVLNDTSIVPMVSPTHVRRIFVRNTRFLSVNTSHLPGAPSKPSIPERGTLWLPEGFDFGRPRLHQLCSALFVQAILFPDTHRTSRMQMALCGRQRWKRTMLAVSAHRSGSAVQASNRFWICLHTQSSRLPCSRRKLGNDLAVIELANIFSGHFCWSDHAIVTNCTVCHHCVWTQWE